MAIQLKDLVDAQKKLKDKENMQSERMSISEFRKLASDMEGSKQAQEKSAAAQQDLLKKGLLEKTGDGLNSNMMKLADELKKQTKLKVKGVEQPGSAPASASPKNPETVEARSREQAGRYVPGTKDYLKEKLGFEMPKPGAGIKDWGKSMKGMFSLEGMLDMSAGKNTGGLFGGQVRRKVEENQYVKDQMAVNPMRTGKQYKDLSDEEFKAKRSEDIRKQYKRNLDVRGEMKANESEIDRMRQANYSESDIGKAGLLGKRDSLDEKLRGKGMDAQYRQQRKADEGGRPTDVFAAAAPLNSAATTGPLAASVSGLVGGEESQSENLRMMVEQNEMLKKIEENTRGTKPTGASGQTPPAASAAQPESGGGSLLGDIVDTAGDFLGKRGGVGKIAGKAAGFLGKNAGKIGAIGGVAMGAYSAYKGWGEANDKVASGEITADQADVMKSEAVGGGVGGAAGAWGGAAAGAAIGSVIPVVGTAIGGLIGGTLGYMGGSAAGGAIAGAGAKAWKGVTGFFGGGDKDKAQPEQKAAVGDSLKQSAMMSIPGVGMASSLMGGVKSAGSWIGDKASSAGNWVSDKVNYVKEQTNMDLAGKRGVTMADMNIGSNQQMTTSEVAGPDGVKSSRTMSEGVTSEKSLFGSTTLGTIFSKKGQEIGNFLGSGSTETDDNGKVSGEYGRILGKRVSGGLFGRDKYSASLEGKDGTSAYKESFSKKQYMELQGLSGAGKYDEAEAKFKEFQAANAEPTLLDRAKKVGGSLLDKAKGFGADVMEYGQRGVNAVSDAAYTVGATAGANIDRYTGIGKALGKATNSVKNMFGISTEEKIEDLGNGAKKIIKPDGSYTISDGSGTKEFDNKGKFLKETSPNFMGTSMSTDAAGNKTTNYAQGPMSLSKTDLTSGGSQMTAGYDLGVVDVKMRKTLTARQKAELDAVSGVQPSTADQVYKTSGDNAEAAAAPSGGTTIINNNNSSSTNMNQTQNYAPKGPARNTESSYRQYDKSRYAF